LPREEEMKRVFLIMAILLVASTGRPGEVWKWVDETGAVHFTDSPESVPKKYREHMDHRELSGESEESPGTAGEAKQVTEEPRDRYNRGEDYWVKRANEVKKQLNRAQREYEQVRLEYNDLIAQYNSTRSRTKRRQYQKKLESLQGQFKRRGEDIERTKEILEKTLPEEAESAGVPTEWVK
jgi:hypothetical protein